MIAVQHHGRAEVRLPHANQGAAAERCLKQMKAKPDPAEIELPESDAERAWIIATEQFVGRSCVNEMLCRRVWTLVRHRQGLSLLQPAGGHGFRDPLPAAARG